MSEAQVPFAPENEIQDVENDPQVRHLEVFHEMEHPKYGKVKMPHRPIRVDGDRDIEARPPPDLGEHTDEVVVRRHLEAWREALTVSHQRPRCKARR